MDSHKQEATTPQFSGAAQMNEKYILRPEYCDVSGEDYLERWIAQRRHVRQNIKTIASITGERNVDRSRPGRVHYYVPDIIDKILAEMSGKKLSKVTIGIINSLQGKFEVFQRIVSGYNKDFRKYENAEEIDTNQYILLSRIFFNYYALTGSTTYLSTSLKVVDRILFNRHPEMREDSVSHFVKLIDDQLRAISKLQKP